MVLHVDFYLLQSWLSWLIISPSIAFLDTKLLPIDDHFIKLILNGDKDPALYIFYYVSEGNGCNSIGDLGFSISSIDWDYRKP